MATYTVIAAITHTKPKRTIRHAVARNVIPKVAKLLAQTMASASVSIELMNEDTGEFVKPETL